MNDRTSLGGDAVPAKQTVARPALRIRPVKDAAVRRLAIGGMHCELTVSAGEPREKPLQPGVILGLHGFFDAHFRSPHVYVASLLDWPRP